MISTMNPHCETETVTKAATENTTPTVQEVICKVEQIKNHLAAVLSDMEEVNRVLSQFEEKNELQERELHYLRRMLSEVEQYEL